MDKMVVGIQLVTIQDTMAVVVMDTMDMAAIMEDSMVLEQISSDKVDMVDMVEMEVMVGLEVMAVFHLIMDIIQMIIMVIVTLVTVTIQIQI